MKIFIEITEESETSGDTKTVQIFNSLEYFQFLWQTPENFGSSKTARLSYKIMTPEEIEKFLHPFQLAVIETDKKKAEAKKILEDCKAANDALFALTGEGYLFQDADGTVYKTNEPEGKFVYFEKVEILRTRREGETKGSLSMKEARDAGFVVEGK